MRIRSRYFDMSSWSGNTADAEPSEFDIAILFAGWERRVIEVTRLPFKATVAALVSWLEAASPQSSWSKEIAEALSTNVSPNVEDLRPYEMSMVANLEENAARLAALLAQRHQDVGRPLRVLIDISNCPEYYAMAILAFSLRAGIAASWTFFYAEAEYPAAGGPISFTHGRWNALPVPYLRAPVDPEADTCLILGLGFEGEQALQLFNRYQPEKVHLLLASPGFTERYTERALAENRNLLKTVDGDDDVLKAPAGDALTAYLGIAEVLEPNDATDGCNFVLIPTGPKPHAIAMALAAFGHSRANVLYRNPEQFHVNDSVATGRAWLFTVDDRSAVVT